MYVTIASFIVVLAVLFMLVTHVVIQQSFDVMVSKTRGNAVDALAAQFQTYYTQHGESWDGVQKLVLDDTAWSSYPEVTIVMQSRERKKLYVTGEAEPNMVTNLGIKRVLRGDRGMIGWVYYYDEEVAPLAKLQIGIPVSVTFLLSAATIALVLVSLLVAYVVARRVTAPLGKLMAAIDRLGQGDLGIQAAVRSRDEYGKAALAFNAMSSQLQQTELSRRNLVADVAHELRTPLTIVRGKLDLLQQAGEAVEPKQLLPLQDELIRLSRLVDDLHMLSLAEARRLPLEKKETPMVHLVQRVLSHVEPDAADKQITLKLKHVEGETKTAVDPNRMTQVLLNLVVNAIRYTPSGGTVTVAVQPQPGAGQDAAKLRITVSDTGVGIAPEQLPNVFNRFYRTDEARARNSGGMGLGLAIAKEFVAAHHGTLSVKSVVGQGTDFMIELPMGMGG